jgi:uncharacterized membrane protein YeiB
LIITVVSKVALFQIAFLNTFMAAFGECGSFSVLFDALVFSLSESESVIHYFYSIFASERDFPMPLLFGYSVVDYFVAR